MRKQTEDILTAFAIHEKLSIKKVRAIFEGLSKGQQKVHVKEMKKVLSTPLSESELVRLGLKSPATNGNKKDEE